MNKRESRRGTDFCRQARISNDVVLLMNCIISTKEQCLKLSDIPDALLEALVEQDAADWFEIKKGRIYLTLASKTFLHSLIQYATIDADEVH